MRKFIPLRIFSQLIILAILTAAINGVSESASAMQRQISVKSFNAEASVLDQYPCNPLEQQKDYEGCDTCINCACHAPLTMQQVKLNYEPVILHLRLFEPFKYFPEVYLSKFIPPQNLA